MARVYRAYHPQLDRYVAVKLLRSDLTEQEELLTRFRREAQAVAALRHTNIVQVFDFDVQDDRYYLVMELLEGDSLRTRLNDYRARGEQMPWGEIVRVLLDVLDGLAYAHSEGMIHRDVKPANIMLTKRGQAVITDFGIAQIVGGTRHTVSGALMGTVQYMAPEQGMEGEGDARSDIYSLGIVFYEMLTRRPPFDADTPLAVLMKHVNDPLPLPREINPDIPLPFERIVLKALAKRPEERYQSAAQMAQALREAAAEAGIELPARISLPLSFATAEAPSESVAVFSGTAREKIADDEFAAEDTDPTLGQRLTEERAAGKSPPARSRTETSRGCVFSVGVAILQTLGILSIGNLVAVMLAGATGQWAIYDKGWPVQLFLTSLGLCMIMDAAASIWMLIPVGLVLGNGLILSYYALTDNWEHWAFLWPLEPLLLIGTIVLTVWLAGQGDRSRTSRLLARALGLLAVALAALVALVALASPWM
jgi:serine/threonine protein kinase